MSVERARTLRKRLSPPEARLWNALRRPPFADHHFRRQVPLGPYYADFASHGAKLVIEVDGGQHFDDLAEQYDRARDARMQADGYTVTRFTASEVLNNLDGVLTVLLATLPHPSRLRRSTLPTRGRERTEPPASGSS